MHLRSSQVRGIPVIDDGSQNIAGFLRAPLIDPDSGRILGFFVIPAFLGHEELFLQTIDIAAWGTRVHIRSEDCLSPPGELIRLKKILSDPRRVIGQSIYIKETKKLLGVCADIQCNTRHFLTEWIFPRKFLFARQPISMNEIIEITPEGIFVKEPLRMISDHVKKENATERAPLLSDIVPTT